MKRKQTLVSTTFVLLVLLASAFGTFSPVSATSSPGKYAFLICMNYPGERPQDSVPLAICDINDWRGQLLSLSYEITVYADSATNPYITETLDQMDLQIGGDDSLELVRAKVQDYASNLGAGDTFVFMYSGHGGADPPEPPSDYGTLILHTDPDVIEEDYYDNVFVADVEPFVNKGGKLFVFVESCASGGFGEKLMGLSDATNIYCVAACDIDGYSQEVDDTGKIRYPRGKKFIAVNGMATWAFLEYSWKTQFNNEPHTACEDIFPVGYDKVQSENSKYYKRYPEDFPQEFDGDPTSYYYID